MLIMQLMVKYIPKKKISNIFYKFLQIAILRNNEIPLWNASSHCIEVLDSVSKLYIVSFPSNNALDTLKLQFFIRNIFLNLLIQKNSVRCAICRKKCLKITRAFTSKCNVNLHFSKKRNCFWEWISAEFNEKY